MSEILDKEEMQNHQSEEITDSDDSQESSVHSETDENGEEDSEDSESDDSEDSEEDDEEQDAEEEDGNTETPNGHCHHSDIDVKRTVECPKCHWQDVISDPSPRLNMTSECSICKNKFPLNLDTAESIFRRCNDCKTLSHFSKHHGETV